MPRYEIIGRAGVGVPPTQFDLRQALTIGTYEPSAATAGLLPDRPLTVVTGNITATDGQVIKDLEIRGRVLVTDASDVLIDNCWVRGAASPGLTSNRGLVHVSGSSTNLTVRDSLIEPQTPSQWWDAIRTFNFTAVRCRFRGCTDHLGVFCPIGSPAGTPTGVSVLGCWFDRLTRWATSAEHADGTHNDCIEIQGGTGTVIRGNRFDAYFDPDTGDSAGLNRQTPQRTTANACIQFANNISVPIAGTLVEKNWFRGGEYGLNASVNKFGGGTGNIVRDNFFDHGQTAFGNGASQIIGGDNTVCINLDSNAGITFSNNRYVDNDVLVPIRRP